MAAPPTAAILGPRGYPGRRKPSKSQFFSKELDVATGLLKFGWFGRRQVLERRVGKGPVMTLAIAELVSDTNTFEYGGARVRAHCRHLATVVTLRGEIDGLNAARIGEYIGRFVLEQTDLVLDMNDVTHFAPAGISLLHRLDEECRAAGAEWTLVASPAVIEMLDDGPEPLFSTARSVHAALHNLADAIVSRRQLVLPLIKKTA